MPKAVTDIGTTEKIELKSCPEGFIVVRRLTYGEKLERRAMVSGMKVEAGKGKDFAGEMQLMNEKATLYDFQKCIVEHNLEKDDDGTLLDFSKVSDIRLLDPRIGEEIETVLGDLNNFEDDEGN